MLWFSANYLERYWYWMEWQSETQGYLCLSNSPKVLINRSADSFYRSQTGSACRNKHVFLFLTSPSIKSKSESIMLWAKSYNNHTWFKNNLAFNFFSFPQNNPHHHFSFQRGAVKKVRTCWVPPPSCNNLSFSKLRPARNTKI